MLTTTNLPIKVAYADDHEMMRAGLCNLLNNRSTVRVVLDARNGQELIRKIEDHKELPDVVILDIFMPQMNSKAILAHISNNLRNASYSMNGDYIRLHGLHEVLERELRYIQDTKKMECTLRVEEYYRSMHPQTELLVFRIAQEALHNVTKHSCATGLDVLLQYQPTVFTMVIADNGVGFSVDSPAGKRKTLGIQSMSQRAGLLDAGLEIDAAPNNGCRVTLEMSRSGLYLN